MDELNEMTIETNVNLEKVTETKNEINKGETGSNIYVNQGQLQGLQESMMVQFAAIMSAQFAAVSQQLTQRADKHETDITGISGCTV